MSSNGPSSANNRAQPPPPQQQSNQNNNQKESSADKENKPRQPKVTAFDSYATHENSSHLKFVFSQVWYLISEIWGDAYSHHSVLRG